MKARVTILSLLSACTLWAQQETPGRWLREGNTHYRRDEYAKAIELYAKIPDNTTDGPAARYNTANALYKLDRKVEAMQLLTALAREAGESSLKQKAWYNRGVILSGQKNLEESIESYKNALRIDPSDREARENLQKALLELKKKPPPPKKEEKKEPQKQDQPQKQPNKSPSKMSPKEAEQRLKLLQQKEKEVQQRMQQAKSKTGGAMPKDW